MPANTPIVGHPVHAVATYTPGGNEWGVKWIDWTAQCGATGTRMGAGSFDLAGGARRLELCAACFPGRDHNACKLDKPRLLRS